MDIYSSIFTRKSTRKFDMAPFAADTLKQLETYISGVSKLLPQSKLTHKILGPEEIKGLGIPKAPHYLIISGESQPLRNTCAGFLYQHAELYLYSMGYATRWLATLRSKENDQNQICGFAFGKPTEPATRKIEEFERKSIAEIASGMDKRLEAARLAPSGRNAQPWYFIIENGAAHVYCMQSLGGLTGMLYHLTDLDVGIALCHFAVASEHEGKPFRFNPGVENAPEPPKGYYYIGTVE